MLTGLFDAAPSFLLNLFGFVVDERKGMDTTHERNVGSHPFPDIFWGESSQGIQRSDTVQAGRYQVFYDG